MEYGISLDIPISQTYWVEQPLQFPQQPWWVPDYSVWKQSVSLYGITDPREEELDAGVDSWQRSPIVTTWSTE